MAEMLYALLFASAGFAWMLKSSTAPAYATATADWDYFMAERAAENAAKGDYT